MNTQVYDVLKEVARANIMTKYYMQQYKPEPYYEYYKKSCKYDEMSAISLLGTTSLIPSTFLLFTNPDSYNKTRCSKCKTSNKNF